MYLYEEKETKFNIYSFHPKTKEIHDYRANQLKQIPNDELVMCGATRMGIESYEILKNYQNQFDTEIIPIENADGEYHRLEKSVLYRYDEDKKVFLEKYYSGEFINNKIARIRDLKKIKYFLLSETEYGFTLPDWKIMEGLLQIPESLYLLSLIEQQKFSLIGNKDISEQLSLFNLEKVDEISQETLMKISLYGMAPYCFANNFKKAKNDEHILKLLKK